MNVTEVPVHILLADAAILTEGVTCGVTFIVMRLLIALGVVKQVALLVSIQPITSPLLSVAEVKIALFVPMLLPLRVHSYVGALPPLVRVAVKVTDVPAQKLFAEATILTDGVTCAVTFIVMLLLVALGVVKQVALLVSIQLITSLLLSVAEVKIALFGPTLLPLRVH